MSSAETSASVRLYHGTDFGSANNILHHGLDEQRAIASGGHGEFYATADRAAADWLAAVNNQKGPPARFEFDLPDAVLQDLLSRGPGAAGHLGGSDLYVFYPASYGILNASMTNKTVVPLP